MFLLAMMLDDLFGKLYDKAHEMTCGSILYRLSLLGTQSAPLIQTPSDIWQGDAGRGQWLCSGSFEFEGTQIALGTKGWENDAILTHPFWAGYAMRFDWLRDLKALGGDAGRLGARHYVKDWIDCYHNWDARAWGAGWTGRRIANWLSHFEFFGRSAPDEFIDLVIASLSRQLRHLTRVPPHRIREDEMLQAAKGLIFGGLCLEGQEIALVQGEALLKKALEVQILADGGHVSRSPQILLDWACDCMDILMLVRKCHYTGHGDAFGILAQTLDRMVQALRFFRCKDGKLPLFNGAQEGDANRLETLFRCADNRSRKVLSALPESGYERLVQDKTQIIFDVGVPPKRKHNHAAHAGVLGFECSYGKERLIVNCGTHPVCPEWGHILKSSAAHSTLIVDERNSCEILPDGHIGRTPAAPKLRKTENRHGVLIEAEHAGYEVSLGLTHMRRLFMTERGHDIRGEDLLMAENTLKEDLGYAIRFHLHPRAQVTLVQGGTEALIKLPSGAGWRFRQEGASFGLEAGIYLGKGTIPRKTNQIVLSGRFTGGLDVVKWALQLEG